jgi:hypothetical protein
MKHRANLVFEKIVIKGEPMYELISSNGVLNNTELPFKYVCSDMYFYHSVIKDSIITAEHTYDYGTQLTEDEYIEFTEYLTQCGHRLTQVIKSEIQIRKTHNGTIVFKV